jgi:hypothetical protein
MILARNGHLRMGPENEGPEGVLGIHHVEERKARVAPRSR